MSFIKKHLFLLIITGVGLLILLFPRQDQALDEYEVIDDAKQRSTNDPSPNENKETPIIVDVKGEVHDPGVYEADREMRVQDIIDKAGGFTNAARQSSVNLAQKVQDEMVIVVPDEDDENRMPENAAAATDDKVRINQAKQEDVETLSGIGPSKAEAIIEYRDEHGPFQTIEDLLEVSGIGQKTIEGFESDIQIP